MGWLENVNRWNAYGQLDSDMKKQMSILDKHELKNCFCENIEFGVGGMRGKIGPGPNRINTYSVRKVAEGLARYIKTKNIYACVRGVVIAYDTRYKSEDFAKEVARTLGVHGIPTFMFSKNRSTPELSFAVRYLQAYAGVMISASSHSSPEYNGLKVYGPDGGQLTSPEVDILMDQVNEVEDELKVKVVDIEELLHIKLLTILDSDVDLAYLSELRKLVQNPPMIKKMADDICIVYTSPIHATTNILVKKALEEIGFTNVHVLSEHKHLFPAFFIEGNPDAFSSIMNYGKKIKADVLLATDPGLGRLRAAIGKNIQGEYHLLTGNELGALLLQYLLTQKYKHGDLPKNSVLLKSIVASDIGREIAKKYSLRTIDTLKGFKYIGKKIKELEESKDTSFLFGYEESYGYLISDFVRDKDAVQASLLLAEAAAYYKSKGITVYDMLLQIFNEFGYYKESVKTIAIEERQGFHHIHEIISIFRKRIPLEWANNKVVIIEDYHRSERVFLKENFLEYIDLPKATVLKYIFEDDSWFCLRPSSKDAKITINFGVRGTSFKDSGDRLYALQKFLLSIMDSYYKELV
ncbi:phospho-sugar mutase [Evansella sp. AB-rgal1]|uniref:phospho-sugar mutase n=1 Tax=Evansella sp. AB-rgal1 TaxID=3242696 RepID=UPI00359E4401